MIEVQGLTKRYGDFMAVDDISFRVERGEIVGFLGLNGAGKTTTMRMLTCYMPATSGSANIAGFDVFEQSLEVRRRIGYLPERPPLYTDMTVRSYLAYVATLSGMARGEIEDRIDAVEDRCGLADVDGRLIGHLSKGYRQRVGLAQALVHNPDVLIMDEPTSALDPAQRYEIRTLIKELAQDHTILLSTHILPEVEDVCERVVIINEGRVVARERIDELSSSVAHAEKVYVETFDKPDDFDALAMKINDVKSVEKSEEAPNGYFIESALGKDVRRPLSDLVHEKGWGLKELRALQPTLEDIFLKLVTRDTVERERAEAAEDAAEEAEEANKRDEPDDKEETKEAKE